MQMLLAELDHRNIRLHERVTEALVNQRYKFGRPLGQGSSAMVHEARHKRTGREVAIKVIKKDDDMNDDESMATELEILKVSSAAMMHPPSPCHLSLSPPRAENTSPCHHPVLRNLSLSPPRAAPPSLPNRPASRSSTTVTSSTATSSSRRPSASGS